MTTPSRTLHQCTSPMSALWLILMLAGCEQAKPPAPAPAHQPLKFVVEPEPQSQPFVQEASPAPMLNKTFNIPADKTRITATVTEVDGGYHQIRIRVKEGQKSFSLESVVAGLDSPSDLPAHLKKTIGWKGTYLFVRSECGGGNAFRCDVDHVFNRVDGQLRKLGTVGVWPTMADNIVTIGPGFRDDFLLDVDATLEGNEFTGHAGAPFIKLALRDQDNRLTLDRTHTWEINHARFAENIADSKAALSDPDAETKANAANGLLFNLAVAKLTGRDSDYREALAVAQKLSGKTYAQRLAKTATSALDSSSNPNLKSDHP